ncbi:MAG: hypothetical protein WCK88_00710 [bacterium]
MAIIIGALMIYVHNIWVADWTVLVTIIGWTALIKGIWLTVLPQSASKFRSWLQPKNHSMVTTIVLVLGLIF